MSTWRRWVSVLVVGWASVCAYSEQVTYQATIEIDSFNSFVGELVAIDEEATVVVDYGDNGAFTITSIEFEGFIPALQLDVTLGESGTLSSAGTITAGVASGEVHWEGIAISPQQQFTLVNTGGAYEGTVSGNGRFADGDVYELLSYNTGTISPAIAGAGNWDHRSALDDNPELDLGTRIIFHGVDTVPPDLDFDTDVDEADLQSLTDCRTGPAIPYDPVALPVNCNLAVDGEGILPADFDRDRDIDQVDFAAMQRCFSGEGIAAEDDCF